MIIHEPNISKDGGESIVSSRIEFQNSKIQAPDTIWFKVHQDYHEFITERTDAFVAAMLPLAMSIGENLEVRGRVSSRLAYGLREYQYIANGWWPDQYKIIDINYSQLESCDPTQTAGAVCSTFSGGVDSFYTLWKHLPDNEEIKENRLTHCLIINGFDKNVDLENTGSLDDLHLLYEKMLDNHGIKLITIRTNQQQFRQAGIKPLHTSIVSALTSSTLMLGHLFSKFYIPGSNKYTNILPAGAHPFTDHLFSTETMETIHDGAEGTRVEKTAALSEWPATYSTLRVCHRKTPKNIVKNGLVENCCKCPKCIRTMVTLDLLGALSKYKTFPLPLKRSDIRKIRGLKGNSLNLLNENIDLAVEKRRMDLIFDLRCSMLRNRNIFINIRNNLSLHLSRFLKKSSKRLPLLF